MDNETAHDHRQKELSISLAASSMINASDLINPDEYHANLKRIQEVKEMVQRLEVNNETAHKNFLLDQLEKRAKDGREAEQVVSLSLNAATEFSGVLRIMLARLRNQPGLPETVHSTPSDRAEVILPTTATLVEVPESHSSSYASSAPTTILPPQTIQQGRPAEYHRSLPSQVHQVPSYDSTAFRYYIPPSNNRPQYNATLRSQTPNDGQMGWYTTQNVPHSGVHDPLAHQSSLRPLQVQQPTQSWSSYPPPVIALPAVDTVPGGYASSSGWIKTAPAIGGPNAGFSSATHCEPDFSMQSATSGPSVTSHNQAQNPPSLASTSRVQVAPLGVPTPSATIPSDQRPSSQSHARSAESQSRLISTLSSKPLGISEPQLAHTLLQPQHQPHQLRPQQLPHPRNHSQLQPQPQQHPQHSLQPHQYPQQSQKLPSQRPLQIPSQSADNGSFVGASRPPSWSPQIGEPLPANAPAGFSQTQSHPTTLPEQRRQRSAQVRTDQAMFIKLFQTAVQQGTLPLKAFLLQAKASGISHEWFKAAINSLPRNVWESAVVQVNQSGASRGVPSANVPQSQAATTSGLAIQVVSAQSSPTTIPVAPTTPAAPARPSTTTEGSIPLSVPGQTSGQYAVQLQYYAEQATKSALSAGAGISTTPLGNPPTQKMVATPARDVPHTQVDVRTPKDANKSTLARDILRSLGKIVPETYQEIGDRPVDRANNNNDEGDQPSDINPAQPVSRMASPKPPEVPAPPISIPSAKPNLQAEARHVASANLSTTRPVLKEKCRSAAVIEEPIMIDLTLEDSDESVDGKGQERGPTFLDHSSATAATSSQPVTTNTTNHTPLLEGLSLEERLIDVAADSDNADVRMHSPLLSMATEENAVSELLYPPLGSAELVVPGFEPSPREASEHPLDGRLPLFLPSPSASPAHTEPPETDFEMIESKPFLKRRSADVDEMEIDTELLRRARKQRKPQVYVLIPPAPTYVKEAIKKLKERVAGKDIDSDLEGVGEDEEFQYSHLEELLIEESKSQLLERRCQWLDCDVVLNCAISLLAHLKNHAREEDSQALFRCRWANCQKQCAMGQERDVHLERHTIRPLPCPLAGCDEWFDKPVEVMQHEVQHQRTERREHLIRKPTYRPIVPAIPARLGQPPHWLPSHRVIARRVVKCQISADRHATMGPWILWNIFSPVDLNARKQNASLRSRPTRQVTNYDVDNSDPRRDDYDFLLALSSYPAKNPQLDDLDSTLVTTGAARGLTLWGSGSAVGPEEYAEVLVSEETEAEGKSYGAGVVASARENKERQSGQSVVTAGEDAVERMLAVV